MKKKYSISSKILYRTRVAVQQFDSFWHRFVAIKMSRDLAKRNRKQLISEKGKTVVDGKLLSEIKQYSVDAFGNSSYWPWLAYYTEVRGEFKEGWIPEDYYRFELLPKVNPEKFMRFSEAKTIDHKLFNGSVVEPLLFRTNDLYCSKDGELKTKAEAQRFISELNDEIIIKPDEGRSGRFIMFKHSSELQLDELSADSDLLFQKVVTQHPELCKLYPHSVNTFRVLSYLDQDGEIKIKFIIIRFGRSGARIDNAANGGGWIFIHPDGTPDPVAHDKFGLPIGTQHPDTGTKYADLALPFLPKIIALCQKVHRSFPYTKIIGWDVFINEDEEPRLIEWNANNPFWTAIEARFGPFFKELVI